jgi:hypothetical protein
VLCDIAYVCSFWWRGDAVAESPSTDSPLDELEQKQHRTVWRPLDSAVENLIADPHIIRSPRYLRVVGEGIAAGSLAHGLVEVKNHAQCFPPLVLSLYPVCPLKCPVPLFPFL